MSGEVIVIGAGGHAKVVISTLIESGLKVKGILDDDNKKLGNNVLGIPVIGKLDLLKTRDFKVAITAIGDNEVRKRIVEKYANFCKWTRVIHSFSYVHPTAKIGEGTVVFAGSVIQPDVIIGNHVIVNTGARIDHDCRIADYVHIAPGVKLAGAVTVDEGSFLGINSAVIPNKNIGKWAVLGAGGVVTRDVSDFSVVAGVPATYLKKKRVFNG